MQSSLIEPLASCKPNEEQRAPDAEPRPDLPHPDHLRPARRADALVLEHDFAQSALQLLLWRLGLAVPDVNKTEKTSRADAREVFSVDVI